MEPRRQARLGHGAGQGRFLSRAAEFGPGGQSRPRDAQYRSTAGGPGGKFAALSLLILAMLIWLFTALLFARHGVPSVGPMLPPGR